MNKAAFLGLMLLFSFVSQAQNGATQYFPDDVNALFDVNGAPVKPTSKPQTVLRFNSNSNFDYQTDCLLHMATRSINKLAALPLDGLFYGGLFSGNVNHNIKDNGIKWMVIDGVYLRSMVPGINQ